MNGDGQVPATLAGALDDLGAQGVEWTLLRPPESLSAAEGDTDLLVHPRSLPAVAALLEKRGFVRMPVPGPDLHASAYDREAGRFVWLHIQGELRVAGRSVPADAVLSATVSADGVSRPADDWLLWILLLRALVEKGELAERHRPAVRELAGRWSGGPEELVGIARANGLDPAAVVASAAAGDWAGLMEHSVFPPPKRSLLRRLARVPGRLRRARGMWRRRGISVAVLGPDGAGKSSLTKALARDLPLPTRVQYMGLTGGKLPRADALRIPGLVFAARVAIMWLRYARGLRQMARGGIVVFDRYNLDAVAPSGMRLSPVARFSRQVQGRVVPKPDLALVLDASGETLHRRSGEYDPAVLEGWRQAFAGLEDRLDFVRRLDAERPADEVRRQAEALVWERYGELRGGGAPTR